jgi:hypothetical protein
MVFWFQGTRQPTGDCLRHIADVKERTSAPASRRHLCATRDLTRTMIFGKTRPCLHFRIRPYYSLVLTL